MSCTHPFSQRISIRGVPGDLEIESYTDNYQVGDAGIGVTETAFVYWCAGCGSISINEGTSWILGNPATTNAELLNMITNPVVVPPTVPPVTP